MGLRGGVEEATGPPILRSDVCVIGAGPAGLTVAHELAAAGVDLVVLEAGPDAPPVGGVDVDTVRNVGLPYSPSATRSAGVGGSSIRWCVETPLGDDFVRLRELDVEDLGPGGAGARGWPMSVDDLEPFYRRSRDLLALGPAVGDGPVGEMLERRTYFFARRTVFTEDLPRALREHPRVRLLAGRTVTELVTEPPDDRVRAALCASETEGVLRVEARAFVLAGGALETARLLLASTSGDPAGLGNHHDQVGRHFMEHPHLYSGVVLPPAGQASLAEPTAWDVVLRDGFPVQAKYVVSPELRRRYGLLGAVFKVKAHVGDGVPGFGHDGDVPQEAIDAYGSVRTALRSRDLRRAHPDDARHLLLAAPQLLRYAKVRRSVARDLARGRAVPVQRGFRVHVMAEQEPSPGSRLRLGQGRDRFGVRLADLDWRLSAADVDSVVRGQRLVAEQLGAVVGGRVLSTAAESVAGTPNGGAHHMGTTRMSTSPTDGVVDRDCRVHGSANLFVAGSSVFPRGGAANPTLTIVALAVRLAQHLAVELTTGTTGASSPSSTTPVDAPDDT